MDAMELVYMPATELASAIRAKRVSPVEVVEAVLGDGLETAMNEYNARFVSPDPANRPEREEG